MKTRRISFLCVIALALCFAQSAFGGLTFGSIPTHDWTLEQTTNGTTDWTYGIKGWSNKSVLYYGGSSKSVSIPFSAPVFASILGSCFAALVSVIYFAARRSPS